jgi:hypothetical protein
VGVYEWATLGDKTCATMCIAHTRGERWCLLRRVSPTHVGSAGAIGVNHHVRLRIAHTRGERWDAEDRPYTWGALA